MAAAACSSSPICGRHASSSAAALGVRSDSAQSSNLGPGAGPGWHQYKYELSIGTTYGACKHATRRKYLRPPYCILTPFSQDQSHRSLESPWRSYPLIYNPLHLLRRRATAGAMWRSRSSRHAVSLLAILGNATVASRRSASAKCRADRQGRAGWGALSATNMPRVPTATPMLSALQLPLPMLQMAALLRPLLLPALLLLSSNFAVLLLSRPPPSISQLLPLLLPLLLSLLLSSLPPPTNAAAAVNLSGCCSSSALH
jgi:hypothetical protein